MADETIVVEMPLVDETAARMMSIYEQWKDRIETKMINDDESILDWVAKIRKVAFEIVTQMRNDKKKLESIGKIMPEQLKSDYEFSTGFIVVMDSSLNVQS